MKPPGPTQSSPPEPSESRRAALLSLLVDEDAVVYQAVRTEILAAGRSALGWLRPHLLSREPVLRRRVTEIVRVFDAREADNAFLAFCLSQGENFDLEEGAWLLARTRYPELNAEAQSALLDAFAGELRERIDPSSPPHVLLATVNQYLFEELGFSGNSVDYYNPDNSYLNRVMDRRTGNPINLCLVYLLVARRLRLPITGIGLPGHFVCRFQSTAEEIYIDPFNRGQILEKADCVKYLQTASFGVDDHYLAPLSPRRVLLRICANLHQIYTRRSLPQEATRLQRYLVALGR